MPIPHYQVYQDDMILRMHGFPQFSADPEGNGALTVNGGASKIQIGDLGYFREGRFERIISLDVRAICGPDMFTSTVRVDLDSPECAGNINIVEFSGGVSVAPGTVSQSGYSYGGGPNVRLKCTKGEGAILNVQSGNATFDYIDLTSKMRLGEYMLANYRRWLQELRNAEYLSARDLFLVTGTYMTNNWEAATFQKSAKSIGGDVTVDAILAKGNISIDWSTWTQQTRGFRLGHTHLDRDLPNHNSTSFVACCNSCPHPPRDQCIFLRGWQVREIIDFDRSYLAIPVSVEDVKNVEWRRTRLIRKMPSPPPSTPSTESSDSTQPCSGRQEVLVATVEADGTPMTPEYSNTYDFIAIAVYQKEPRDVILVHDDDVIAFLSGTDVDKRDDLTKGEGTSVSREEAVDSTSKPLWPKGDTEELASHIKHWSGMKAPAQFSEIPERQLRWYRTESIIRTSQADDRPVSRAHKSIMKLSDQSFKMLKRLGDALMAGVLSGWGQAGGQNNQSSLSGRSSSNSSPRWLKQLDRQVSEGKQPADPRFYTASGIPLKAYQKPHASFEVRNPQPHDE